MTRRHGYPERVVMRPERTRLRRRLAAGALLGAAALAGAATSTLGAGVSTVPGTTLTVPTNADGSLDLSNVPIPGLPGGLKIPKDLAVPPDLLASIQKAATTGSIPPELQQAISSLGAAAATTAASTTPGAATTGAAGTPAVPTTPVTPVPAQTTPAPTGSIPGLTLPGAPTTATTATASTRAEDRAATVLLIAVAALLVLAVLAWALARATGWEPEWWPGRRHEASEAAWRFSNGWADFRDWLRQPR